MMRREKRERERKRFMKSTLTNEERDKRMIEEIMEKIANAREFQVEQARRGIKPEPITVSTDWEPF